ncbi:MAG: hypothetical protein AAF368_01335 [Planctomycetota bacterium]
MNLMKFTLLYTAMMGSLLSPSLPAQEEERVPISPSQPEEAPLPPLMDEGLFAEWKLRDLEGRWVLRQRLIGVRPPEDVQAWNAWHAQRGEFDFIERDALDDTNWSSASSLLQQVDAPQWLRLAHWHSNASDSHTWDAAQSALEARPALTLAWIEAHPTLLEDPSTKKLYESLAQTCKEREECAKYLPPFDLDVLYAPLKSMGEVVEFGDRLVAVSGERYVHQTLHAMEILASHKRRPAIWQRRLFDLASAKNLTVRVAALETATRLDPEAIPWTEFRALFDSRGEPDVVRAAAWVALSYAPRVIARRNYSEVLSDFGDIEFSEVLWMLFNERLIEIGGWYELQLLKEVSGTEANQERIVALTNHLTTAWDTRRAENEALAVHSEVELLTYLRAQHEGLQEELRLAKQRELFREWVSWKEPRRAALYPLTQSYTVPEGVFPGGERTAVDGAGRDAETWAKLVAREAESLLVL